MNPTRTQAIKKFLEISTHSDLSALYNHDMEVQVNVARDNGQRIDGDFKGRQWHGWTDGAQTWKAIRIPYSANSNPNYEDKPITFDLAAHAEGIGMTGWDWKNKISRWVAFDFDAISGHSDKHTKKLTEEELQQIVEQVKTIDWVTVRKSTSGKGIHLYVFLPEIVTENHNEHAAVARSVLAKLSLTVGYDFQAKVDTTGGNMWVWHRKMQDTDGLSLIKKGTILDVVPPNWKDHLKIIKGAKKKLPKFIEDIPQVRDTFEELTSQRLRTPLDEEHKALLNWLDSKYPGSSWFDQDHWMLVTHTVLLQEAHFDLKMRGPFKTMAQGREKGHDHNCFCFPLKKGAWSIRRYTPGAAEDILWQQDGSGYTKTFINRDPDLESAAKTFSGIQHPKGGFEFVSGEKAQQAASLIGANLELPTHLLMRKTKMKEHKGMLLVEVQRESHDVAINGWLSEKNTFTRMFNFRPPGPSEMDFAIFDDEIRHLVTETGDDQGWVIKSETNWQREPLEHVKHFLKAKEYTPKDIDKIIGGSITNCWKIVNRPFQAEFLPNRCWNRGAAQLAFTPNFDNPERQYPTWLTILKHCGKGLDDPIKHNTWCQDNGILTGLDYLKCWISSMFQFPMEPLPYLFFYGEQGSGKSIFHESLSLLMTKGYARADNALINSSGFNGELENAILCVVEETDFRKNHQAYNKIKDWVTSPLLPIHKKLRQPYTIPNSTHYVQCANSLLACPVFPGDTRITMIFVESFDPSCRIERRQLYEMLKKEAPDFLAEVLRLELPRCNDRLNIPVVVTEGKEAAQKANETFLESFIVEHCHQVDGESILFSEFYAKFMEWLDPNYHHEWSKQRVAREIPSKFCHGNHTSTNQKWIGNMSWEKKGPTKPKMIIVNGKIVHARPE